MISIMDFFFRLFIFFGLCSLAFSNEALSSNEFPRPLIVQYPDNIIETRLTELHEEVKLQCTSWRFSVEANNIGPWKTIPRECLEYVKDYMMGRSYKMDLERASNEAKVYANTVQLIGSEIFDPVEFDKWVEKAMALAIEPSFKLYEEVLKLGFKIFLLTGRSENKRAATIDNLINAGFQNWDKLILRGPEDHGKLATIYKSEKRNEMVNNGFRILGNSGDQWSDLLGASMSIRSFKLPNPMYYIP
ncbi:hypothetical protein Patl1_20716 [Pistacia atlantica]|uniref:Uncharacterized protein n=1 Tax=Pistacia atlantica TaxID=434234 RepID=A0ACC1BLI1_9ROSI|nr:hypothetical protein Patl1_20716 [Pistacia atlantica]